MFNSILGFLSSILLDERVLYAVIETGENFEGVTYDKSKSLGENVNCLSDVFGEYQDLRFVNWRLYE